MYGMKMRQLSLLLLFISLIMGVAEVSAQTVKDASFESFLKKFTSSASFQLSRVKFPITSPIVLMTEGGDEEAVPFTQEEWVLLEGDDLKIGKTDTPDGVVFGRFTLKKGDHVEFESGLEESELDLSVTFDLMEGQWFVTDCYSGWYGNLPAGDFDATVYEVQQRNEAFTTKHP